MKQLEIIYFNFVEFETILTSVELEKKDKKMFKLEESENQRINKILQKAVDKETGKLSEDDESLTEDNPDGRKFISMLPFAFNGYANLILFYFLYS